MLYSIEIQYNHACENAHIVYFIANVCECVRVLLSSSIYDEYVIHADIEETKCKHNINIGPETGPHSAY